MKTITYSISKRITDIILSGCGLLFSGIIMLPICLRIFLEDYHTPFYRAQRTGINNKPFSMLKLRTMKIDAGQIPVDATAANDPRITRSGKWIRRYKLDELMQLWNVLRGNMSLVGPRPNVPRQTALYTAEELRLLTIKPGITDLSSIVFSDLSDIICASSNPNTTYDRLVRPWKSRLALFYLDHQSYSLDIKIILLTVVSLFSRQLALKGVVQFLTALGAPHELIAVAKRNSPLKRALPPGALVPNNQREWLQLATRPQPEKPVEEVEA